jgi:small subunit ribosomal protein S16
MATKIRLQRHGATHRPVFKLVVAESTARRDGKFIESLGIYDPQFKREEEQIQFKLDRIDYWMSVGAQPTDTAKNLIRKVRKAAKTEGTAAAAE